MLACTATGGLRYDLAAALYRFCAFCAATSAPEIHDLAETIETWQAPMILAITTGLTNARSEGYNRIVKHVGRIAFGFRNPDNQRRLRRVVYLTSSTASGMGSDERSRPEPTACWNPEGDRLIRASGQHLRAVALCGRRPRVSSAPGWTSIARIQSHPDFPRKRSTPYRHFGLLGLASGCTAYTR